MFSGLALRGAHAALRRALEAARNTRCRDRKTRKSYPSTDAGETPDPRLTQSGGCETRPFKRSAIPFVCEIFGGVRRCLMHRDSHTRVPLSWASANLTFLRGLIHPTFPGLPNGGPVDGVAPPTSS